MSSKLDWIFYVCQNYNRDDSNYTYEITISTGWNPSNVAKFVKALN